MVRFAFHQSFACNSPQKDLTIAHKWISSCWMLRAVETGQRLSSFITVITAICYKIVFYLLNGCWPGLLWIMYDLSGSILVEQSLVLSNEMNIRLALKGRWGWKIKANNRLREEIWQLCVRMRASTYFTSRNIKSCIKMIMPHFIPLDFLMTRLCLSLSLSSSL